MPKDQFADFIQLTEIPEIEISKYLCGYAGRILIYVQQKQPY